MTASEKKLRLLFPRDKSKKFSSPQHELLVHTLKLTHRRLMRLRHLVGTARVAGKQTIMIDEGGRELAKCDTEDGANGDHQGAIYTLYFDPQTRAFYRSIVTMTGDAPILASDFHTREDVDAQYYQHIKMAV